MQSWDSVKVVDTDLESFGKAGTVRSAGPYEADGDKKGEKVQMIDVLIDGDAEPTAFRVEQVAAI